LIVQPKRSDSSKPIHWRLAKGVIEEGESTKEAALREIAEETAIKTEILDKIGQSTYFYSFKGEKIFKIITFYLMRFQKDTGNRVDEIEIEKIEWLPYKGAYAELTFDSDRKILVKAKKILEEKERQQNLL